MQHAPRKSAARAGNVTTCARVHPYSYELGCGVVLEEEVVLEDRVGAVDRGFEQCPCAGVGWGWGTRSHTAAAVQRWERASA